MAPSKRTHAPVVAAIFGLAMGLSLSALAFGVRENTITLTPQEVQECKAEGGCVILTMDYVRAVAAEMKRLRDLVGKSCL